VNSHTHTHRNTEREQPVCVSGLTDASRHRKWSAQNSEHFLFLTLAFTNCNRAKRAERLNTHTLSFTYTHLKAFYLGLHTLSLSLSLSHTITETHKHTHSFSLTHTYTQYSREQILAVIKEFICVGFHQNTSKRVCVCSLGVSSD